MVITSTLMLRGGEYREDLQDAHSVVRIPPKHHPQSCEHESKEVIIVPFYTMVGVGLASKLHFQGMILVS